jgi:signal transduction histidine kinase
MKDKTFQKIPKINQRSVTAPLYMAVLTMLIVMATVWAFEYSEQQRFEQQIRTDVINQVSAIRAQLEASLNSRLFLMRGLIAYVSINPDITQAEFAQLAKATLKQEVGIHSLNLAQGTTITHLYPVTHTETTLGIDLITIPSLKTAVERSMLSRETIVAGPVELTTGETVFVNMTPIFLTSKQKTKAKPKYWGLGLILINQESLFEEAGLLNSPHFQYALRGRDGLGAIGGVFFGQANIFQQKPIIQSVSLPNGSWRLAAVPMEGWPINSPISKWLWFGGSMLALMTGILVFTVVNAPAQLQEAINKATKELRKAHEDIQRLEQQKYEQLAEHNRTLEGKVAERTKELSQAIENLKETQQELINSEKMAALGQLIAGIAHEINTPLGAIRSSVANISNFLNQHLEQLPKIFQSLSLERQHDFFALLKQISQPEIALSSREKRKHRRTLAHQLKEQAIEYADSVADTLVETGIYENIDPFLPLLKEPESKTILNTAYQLASLQTSTQTISMATDRADKVIFALKSFSHYDRSGQKTETNLSEGIETVLTLYHSQLKHHVTVIKNYSDLPPVLCYPDELNQVWTNLIHNALQAMNNKGTLQIDTILQDNHVVVSITDSGAGIPDDIKSQIFAPFFTTKPAGEGSGLGLDIVKKIVDKHEGKIEVTSQPGQTTFSVFIPLI